MNLTDYLVILAIIASAVVGAWRGLLREAVALAAWVIALFLAWHFSDLIAPHLGGLMSDSGVRPWAARVIIVLLVLLVRSEEHTSELQSLTNLVCRLLLEKKK